MVGYPRVLGAYAGYGGVPYPGVYGYVAGADPHMAPHPAMLAPHMMQHHAHAQGHVALP